MRSMINSNNFKKCIYFRSCHNFIGALSYCLTELLSTIFFKISHFNVCISLLNKISLSNQPVIHIQMTILQMSGDPLKQWSTFIKCVFAITSLHCIPPTWNITVIILLNDIIDVDALHKKCLVWDFKKIYIPNNTFHQFWLTLLL